MSQGLQSIVDKMESGEIKKISKDDTFQFGCEACGKCCRNRNDIIVNPYDVFKLAKYLGISNHEFLQKYTTYHIGPNSGWPLFTIRFKDKSIAGDQSDTVCTFLKHKEGKFLCSVHEAKPFICVAYPLGRIIEQDLKTNEKTNVNYILQPMECGRPELIQDHKVRDWIRNDEISEQGFVAFHQLMDRVESESMELRKLVKSKLVDDEKKEMVMYPIVQKLYIDYDHEKPFLEQLAENSDTIVAMLKDLKKMADDFKVKLY